ncbi:MAG: AAA family ATPase [Bacteroidia bacterium]|nr:AAA family ATPase [Bacteroidia bacterium]
MKNPPKLHQQVFEILDKKRIQDKSFRFTLRQINRGKRLEKGYWFHGNEHYLAVSFWAGFDWKNKTPDIIFVITDQSCYLEIPAIAGGKKKAWLEENLIPKIPGMKKDGVRYRKWYARDREQIESGYFKNHLHKFLQVQYPEIDGIIKKSQKVLSTHLNPIEVISLEKFKKLLDRRAYWEKRKLEVQKQKIKGLPFALLDISIRDFLGIKDCEISNIPPDTQCIFLTGENSMGKSTILKAIALALTHDTNQSGRISSSIRIRYLEKGKVRKSEVKFEQGILKEDNPPPANQTGYAAYGPFRLEMTKEAHSGALRNNPNKSLFSTGVPLLNFEPTIRKFVSPGAEGKRFTWMKRSYLEAVQSLIPEVTGIAHPWAGDPFPAFLMLKAGSDEEVEQVSYRDLASGAKNILGLLSDMLARLFESQKEVDEISNFEGIVLVDEIDLHLHPKFQRRLVRDLTETFPNVQFIFTTHSPIPLLGAPEKSEFFVVRNQREIGINVEHLNSIEIRELTPNSILTSPIFGMDNILHTHFDPETNDYVSDEAHYLVVKTESTYGEVVRNKRMLSSLVEQYKERKGKEENDDQS